MKTKRLQWVINGLESRNICFESANEYGEPGYSTDKPCILFANWNEIKSKATMRAIKAVAEVEWSDEWTIDYSDGCKAYRTSPDCYGWEASFFYHDGEIVPYSSLPSEGEELLDSLREYGFVHDQQDRVELKAVPSCVEECRLESFASLVNGECETGFHHGQNDKPEKIMAGLPAGEYLFRISDKGQFDIHWQVWKVNAAAE